MKNHITDQLASAPVGRLITKFSIPCILSLVVNGLYNIVDQIFIGNGIGYIGNSATNVVFPLTILCVALGVLFGDGAATYMSLMLGQERQSDAEKGVINGILLSVLVSLLLFAISVIFLKQIVFLFGCTQTVLPYALGYGSIVVFGFPFVMISTTVNSIIRADGSPGFAMLSLVSGAVFNTVMDPVFIFLFKWGVQGAALATIMGQCITFVISLLYRKKWKSVRIRISAAAFSIHHCRSLIPMGISSFINQMATVIMTAVINNMLTAWGAVSVYGTDIPLAVMGITLKINQIFLFIVIGIAAGAQPIISFNYGAQKYDRVLKAFRIVVLSSLAASTAAFLLFQFKPMLIVSLFGSESDLYNTFAVKSFRIFLLLCIPDGFQTFASIFVQAIGKPKEALILSLSRQIVFLIPAVILLPHVLGIEGVLWAGPLADAPACILALRVTAGTVKELRPVH